MSEILDMLEISDTSIYIKTSLCTGRTLRLVEPRLRLGGRQCSAARVSGHRLRVSANSQRKFVMAAVSAGCQGLGLPGTFAHTGRRRERHPPPLRIRILSSARPKGNDENLRNAILVCRAFGLDIVFPIHNRWVEFF